MGRGHPTSRPTSYVTGLEVLLEAKNAEIAKLQAQVDELKEAVQPFVDAFDRAKEKESWAASYLNNNAWAKAKAAIKGGE